MVFISTKVATVKIRKNKVLWHAVADTLLVELETEKKRQFFLQECC